MLARVQKWLGLDFLTNLLKVLLDRINDVLILLQRPVPKPFVAVIAQGQGPNGPIMLGMSTRAGEPLELMSQNPLTDVYLFVCTDLEKVVIEGIYCGIDHLGAGAGDCPVARLKTWPVGVLVTIRTCVR